MPKILAFGSSLRAGSLNKQLARTAAETARKLGAEVTYIDLSDFSMPVYNGDDEDQSGLPEGALRFKHLLQQHDGFIISSAEYNGFFTAALKNAIDWASRKSEENEPPRSAFNGKTVVLLSAAPGALGGLRALPHLKALLGNIGVVISPGQLSLSNAKASSFDGTLLADTDLQSDLEALLKQFVELTARLK